MKNVILIAVGILIMFISLYISIEIDLGGFFGDTVEFLTFVCGALLAVYGIIQIKKTSKNKE